MKDTAISPLSAFQRKRIKKVVKCNYGIETDDHDIDWIDGYC